MDRFSEPCLDSALYGLYDNDFIQLIEVENYENMEEKDIFPDEFFGKFSNSTFPLMEIK